MDNWNRHMHEKLNSYGLLQQSVQGNMDTSSTCSALTDQEQYLICTGAEDATTHMLIIMIKNLQKGTGKMSHDNFSFCLDFKLANQ